MATKETILELQNELKKIAAETHQFFQANCIEFHQKTGGNPIMDLYRNSNSFGVQLPLIGDGEFMNERHQSPMGRIHLMMRLDWFAGEVKKWQSYFSIYLGKAPEVQELRESTYTQLKRLSFAVNTLLIEIDPTLEGKGVELIG